MASPPSNVDLLSNLQFAGLFQRLNPDKEDDIPSATEVVDDYEANRRLSMYKKVLVITVVKMMKVMKVMMLVMK